MTRWLLALLLAGCAAAPTRQTATVEELWPQAEQIAKSWSPDAFLAIAGGIGKGGRLDSHQRRHRAFFKFASPRKNRVLLVALAAGGRVLERHELGEPVKGLQPVLLQAFPVDSRQACQLVDPSGRETLMYTLSPLPGKGERVWLFPQRLAWVTHDARLERQAGR